MRKNRNRSTAVASAARDARTTIPPHVDRARRFEAALAARKGKKIAHAA